MTDKKQLELNLGKVEYIVNPNPSPESLFDRTELDKIVSDNEYTLDSFYKLLENNTAFNNYCISGQLAGEHFFIFDTSDQIANIEAGLNGWKGGEIVRVFRYRSSEKLSFLEAIQEEIDKCNSEYKKTLLKNTYQYYDCAEYLELGLVDIDDFTIDWGFSDQYTLCSECGQNVIRTDPDSYTWEPEFYVGDGFIACLECCKDIEPEIVEETEGKTLPSFIDPESFDLVQVNEDSFETGMHEGMNDDPDKVLELLHDSGIDCWFTVHPSQFYQSWDVLVNKKDHANAVKVLSGSNVSLPYSIADNLKECLSKAPFNAQETEGYLTVTSCDLSTGTTSKKLIPV